MITFAIPSWNRADKLETCLNSMIYQILSVEDDIFICVYNNCSTDNTDQVLRDFKEKYPNIISYENGDKHLQCNDSFKRAFSLPKTEYTWMFGDDDILAPDGLKTVLSLLKRRELYFIHAAEATRAGDDNKTYFATLSELCNGFGFTDMLGFISGNIVKTKQFQDVINSSDNEIYKESSFYQSLAIMDAFSDKPSAFINYPVIDLQDREQTQETKQRWHDENILMKYLNIAEGLARLKEKNKISDGLPVNFFRYLSGDLVTKMLYIIYDYVRVRGQDVESIFWEKIQNIASFMNEENKNNTIKAVNEFRECMDEYFSLKRETDCLLNKLQNKHDEVLLGKFPVTYT